MIETDKACMFRDRSECEGCNLDRRLGCRYSRREFWFFTLNQVPLLVMALFSLVFTGFLTDLWWPLLFYVLGAFVFFGLGLETRILCSHCPYWTGEGKQLNCWAYPGAYKFWRYRPGPMNWLEKSLLIIFFAFLALFPVALVLYDIWIVAASPSLNNLFTMLGVTGIAVGTLMAGVQFFLVLLFHFCSRCVNFSCPFNLVPDEQVKAYLEKNPVMKKAFEQKGFVKDDKTVIVKKRRRI